MDFSESFGLGSSTFDNLESQIKRALDGNVKKSEKEKELDIILESPEGKQKEKNRTRLFQNSKNETQRRYWRRSKSDSKLLIKDDTTGNSRNEHLTQFFATDLGFSMEKSMKTNNDLKGINGMDSKDETQIRVSQIEADFENDNNEVALLSAWEVPICSEDINQITQTEEAEMSIEALKLSDSLELENRLPNLKQLENIEVIENDSESLPLLDANSFLSPIENEENLKAELKATQQKIRQDVSISIREVVHNQNRRLNTSREISVKTNKHQNSTQDKPNKTIPNNLESFKYITSWNLPPSVVGEYKKKRIIEMFDWQVECLSNPKVLLEHCNLVYSAPTSAGKTLVSEILLLKTVIERNKKVLMILPFISVVREKMFYLQDLLTPAGYRVEGFFGGYTPPGGFDSINVAICTIEKANSIVNKLLEQNKLETIGTVVVDEIHLISDAGRGYILELLIAKMLYMSRKYGFQIQIITMSATLSNVKLLKQWLDAELFVTDFRPVALQEMIKIGTKIFDANMKMIRDIAKPLETESISLLPNDADNVAQLCLETVLEGCSVIVFCPSKDWCEKLAIQLASIIHGLGKSGSDLGLRLRQQLNREAIDDVKKQLRDIPTGLDIVLEKTITFACAFHHAGLTTEERDIVEASFKSGALKIIVATSTLSSGVNLPARRVLIRTPLFGGKQMSSLTYKQMIGRAGRTGKDTLGESILICSESNARIGRDLITAEMQPINSCLEMEGSTHLKRALLEVISSGVAISKQDIKNFVNCTLLSAQKHLNFQEKGGSTDGEEDCISGALAFLMEYEFVRLQTNNETGEENYVATRLGLACLASSMPPTDGLILFSELQKSRRCFVLESELHAVYLVTPYSVCYQMQEIDWLFFLDLWEKLSPAMRKVGELVGVKESFLVRAMRGQTKLDYKLMQVHKRFYTALALQELVNETPINVVAQKYKCTRGLLQSLQQMASTFAGIVTAFCNALQWDTLSLIVSQFKERLFFGIHRDLIDLMRLPDLSHKRARAFFDAGITTLIELAQADVLLIEKILYNSLSFDSAKQHENENSYEAEQRNLVRNFFITGKANLTVAEAAKLLIKEARQFVEYEIGAGKIKWTQETINEDLTKLHMSCEEVGLKVNQNEKKRKSDKELNVMPPKLNKSSNEEKYEENGFEIDVQLNDNKENKEKKESDCNKLGNVARRNGVVKQNFVEGNGNYEVSKKNIQGCGKPASKENFCSVENSHSNKSSNVKEKNLNSKKTENDGDYKTENEFFENLFSKNTKNSEATNGCSRKSSTINKDQRNVKENHIISKKTEVLEKNFSEEFEKKQSNERTNSLNSKAVESKQINNENKKDAEIILKENVVCNGITNSKTKELNKARKNQMETFPKPTLPNSKNIGKNIATSNDHNTVSPDNKDETFTIDHKRSKRFSAETKNQKTSMLKAESSKSSHVKPKTVENQNKAQNISNTTPNQQLKRQNNDQLLEQPPRRSPRNHTKTLNNPKTSNTIQQDIQDLFADEESFEFNSCITAALAKAEVMNNEHQNDEIPSSQINEDEKPQSSNNTPRHTTSRLLRSIRSTNPTQRVTSTVNLKTTDQQSDKDQNMSDEFTLDLSNSPYIMQMNATHILSCTKEEKTPSSFNVVEIIDICGNMELFKLAMKELYAAKRFGFCLGIQKLAKQSRPLIGANLLINQIANEANQAGIETAKLFQIDDNIYLEGIAFCISENIVLYMDLQKTTENSISKDLKIKCLQKILNDSKITLIIYEARKQLKLLKKAIPDLNDIHVQLEDPKVANWLLQPDQTLSLKQLAQQFAPECSALVDLCGGGRGYNSHGIDASSAIIARIRCSVESCAAIHILQGQIENLERIGTGELLKFFHELEMPLQLSLCKMEIIGFPASEVALRNLFQKMMETSKTLEAKIFSIHGKRFNLSSAQAVAKVLGLHRKPNGRISTSRQVLEKIDEPISRLIIAYRKLNVIMTKNIQPLLQAVQNDRIHSQSDSFTTTGRISMKEPNLQNVAKNFEIDYGTEKVNISCRSAFFPNESNRCLISADFCQLEMRILAHLSKDPQLIKTMSSENDVFTAIAAVWNNIEESEVSEQLRNGTKQICYGIIYGMGMRALGEALKCSEDEAKLVSEQFHEAYPAIRAFTSRVINDARCNGYVETIQGRRRYLENIKSVESSLKSQAERQAVNSTIQGSAADIAKRAILRSEKSIIKYGSKIGVGLNDVNFILHVHDELIFEVPTTKAKKVAKIISLTMESCIKLRVPLKVKLKMGHNWGEMKEII